MSSGAINGFQTTLVLSSDSTSVTSVTGFSEIVSVGFPELNATDIDITNMDSSSNYMESISGSTDPGTIEVTLNYLETQDKSLSLLVGSENFDIEDTWTITFPDSATWATKGYISNFGAGEATNNDKILRTLTLKCTGLPTHSTN
jgi:hypothetical protein